MEFFLLLFFYVSIRHFSTLFIHSIFFILEMPAIRSAECELPIMREICICVFSTLLIISKELSIYQNEVLKKIISIQ